MAQQSSRELAATDPTTRMQDAGFQVSWVSPKISLSARSHLQHFQRPAPSHLSKNAPSISRVGYEHVVRGSRDSLKIFVTEFSCSPFTDVTMPIEPIVRKKKRSFSRFRCSFYGIRFHGVISIGAPTPIRFEQTNWRLRHLQIPTTPATAPGHCTLPTSQDRSACAPLT